MIVRTITISRSRFQSDWEGMVTGFAVGSDPCFTHITSNGRLRTAISILNFTQVTNVLRYLIQTLKEIFKRCQLTLIGPLGAQIKQLILYHAQVYPASSSIFHRCPFDLRCCLCIPTDGCWRSQRGQTQRQRELSSVVEHSHVKRQVPGSNPGVSLFLCCLASIGYEPFTCSDGATSFARLIPI